MIARVSIGLTFVFLLPEGVEFALHPYDEAGYLVTPRPPRSSDVPVRVDVPNNVKVNGAPAFIANALEIDFQKESFDRTPSSESDPPRELITRAANALLAKLRYITRGLNIRPIDLERASWRLTYLNDDGSELESTPMAISGRGGRAWHLSYAGVDSRMWDDAASLGPAWSPPPWDEILLDANAALPHVGTVVVLAATALEVFIAHILDQLAMHDGTSKDLWGWLNNRGNWLKDPSTEEQFDFLLKHLASHSLKERQDLWEAFAHIRTARNTFVHGGVAVLARAPVTAASALRLLVKANEIVECVRGWLPTELRWPKFETQTQVTVELSLT